MRCDAMSRLVSARSRPRLRGWTAVSLLAISGGCITGGDQGWYARNVDAAEDSIARQFYREIQQGRFDSAAHLLGSPVGDSVSTEAWLTVQQTLANVNIDSLYFVGAGITSVNGVRSANLSYEGPVGDQWFGGHVYVRAGQVLGFSAYHFKRPLAETNSFTLRGKSVRHFVILSAGILAMLVSLTAAGVVWRSGMKRPVLWGIVALLGVGRLTLDWTSGALGLQVISVQVPVLGMLKQGWAAPWWIRVSFPLGAFVALWKMRRSIRASFAGDSGLEARPD